MFPQVDEGADFALLVKDIRQDLLMKAAKRVGLRVIPLGVVGMGIWWAMKG